MPLYFWVILIVLVKFILIERDSAVTIQMTPLLTSIAL